MTTRRKTSRAQLPLKTDKDGFLVGSKLKLKKPVTVLILTPKRRAKSAPRFLIPIGPAHPWPALGPTLLISPKPKRQPGRKRRA